MTLQSLPPDLELPVLQPPKKPHRFTLDNQPAGRGRKKGSVDRITRDLKRGVLLGAHNCGYDGKGLGGVDGFLLYCAQHHPRHYLALLGKMLPMNLNENAPGPGIGQVNIVSIPSGVHLTHEQIERTRRGEAFTLDHDQAPVEPTPVKAPDVPEIEAQTPAEAQLIASIEALARAVGVDLDAD